MKYIVIIGDGMADHPIPELGNKTILEYAEKPNMDYIAAKGRMGLAVTVPDGYAPGSDVANMAIFGYDPAKYYTGRSPLEAVSMGVRMEDDDLSFRCNLITIGSPDGKVGADVKDPYILDYSGGHISSEEAAELIRAVDEKLGSDRFRFYPGISYRHLLISKHNFAKNAVCTPPHDVTGQKVADNLPTGEGAEELTELTKKSFDILMDHPVNIRRMAEGKMPANSIWLWGQGNAPRFESFKEVCHKTGAVVSAVDLLKGIGLSAGLDVIDVEGATGFLDTNYEGKVNAVKEALKTKDFAFIHLEAPDECGHMGSYEKKIQAVEDLDSKVIAPLLEFARASGERYRILVMPDHPTPVELKTHTNEPIPFAVYDTAEDDTDSTTAFTEKQGRAGSYGCVRGSDILRTILLKD